MKRIVVALFTLLSAGSVAAQAARVAELTVEGDSVCSHAGSIDHQVSTETYVLTLPEISGTVSAEGTYVDNGTGYTLSGVAKVAGEVRDDAELVLTHLQWNYNGKWLLSTAPFVPTADSPVVIPLEPGGETTVSFVNAMPVGEAPCTGSVIYRIDFERETQVWEVEMKADRRVLHKLLYGLYESEKAVWSTFDYIHGVTFHYDITVQVTLERRRGAWQYRQGKITRAGVTHDYQQTPKIYKITGTWCERCDQVLALAGQALDGSSDGTILRLRWPNMMPVVHIDSLFAMQCAPGPRKASCERMRKEPSRFSSEDDDTLGRAPGHILKLTPGVQPVTEGQAKATGATKLTLDYSYTLTRVK
jgi:hypothetical protein